MITVKEGCSRKDMEKNVLFFPSIFSGAIIQRIIQESSIRSSTGLAVGLAMLTGKNFGFTKTEGAIACISLSKESFSYKGKKASLNPGSLLLLNDKVRRENTLRLPKISILLYEQNYSPEIYLNTSKRLTQAKNVYKSLGTLRRLPKWEQCVQKNLPLKLLGKGSYGNVFQTMVGTIPCAVKLARIKEDMGDNTKLYDKSVSCWHESIFLKDLLRPLIEKRICPNLPLFYGTFTCKSCDLVFEGEKCNSPCVISIMELASENMKQYFRTKRSLEEIYSALFQIAVAVYTIQYHLQMMNFDVKKENILVYKVLPGGYWLYKIMGIDYYVPNYGHLFVLADFGLARPMSPFFPVYKTCQDQTFRLGSRYAVVKDDIFVPFTVKNQMNEKGELEPSSKIKWENGGISLGAEFRTPRNGTIPRLDVEFPPDLQYYLRSKKLPADVSDKNFYGNSDLVPPFEFFNDTQDVIRMFIGGKRTTQKGHHRQVDYLPKILEKQLKPYCSSYENAKEKVFSSPEKVMAGYFIKSFFGKYTEYKKSKFPIIETYKVS